MAITVYTYNDKVLKNVATDKWLKKYVDPYNPLGLDSGVFRIKVTAGTSSWIGAQTATLVDGTTDVYDVQFTESNTTSWQKSIALQVLGANTAGWTTGLNGIFNQCTNLTSVALFDTSSATDLHWFLNGCELLTSVPLFDISSATDIDYMLQGCTSLTSIPDFNVNSVTTCKSAFLNCSNVETGTLNMYQKLSSLVPEPTHDGGTFAGCGSNTVTGAAELAQIPRSWGGTAT